MRKKRNAANGIIGRQLTHTVVYLLQVKSRQFIGTHISYGGIQRFRPKAEQLSYLFPHAHLRKLSLYINRRPGAP